MSPCRDRWKRIWSAHWPSARFRSSPAAAGRTAFPQAQHDPTRPPDLGQPRSVAVRGRLRACRGADRWAQLLAGQPRGDGRGDQRRGDGHPDRRRRHRAAAADARAPRRIPGSDQRGRRRCEGRCTRQPRGPGEDLVRRGDDRVLRRARTDRRALRARRGRAEGTRKRAAGLRGQRSSQAGESLRALLRQPCRGVSPGHARQTGPSFSSRPTRSKRRCRRTRRACGTASFRR